MPPTTMNSTPASASKTNNFSNDGSIIGGGGQGFWRIIHALRRSISNFQQCKQAAALSPHARRNRPLLQDSWRDSPQISP